MCIAPHISPPHSEEIRLKNLRVKPRQYGAPSQACTLPMGASLFALVAKFEEPVAARRLTGKPAFGITSITGRMTSTRRRSSSIFLSGLTGAQLAMIKSLPRRFSGYQSQGEQDQTQRVSDNADRNKPEGCGSVQCAGTKPRVGSSSSVNPAKVVPEEGMCDNT